MRPDGYRFLLVLLLCFVVAMLARGLLTARAQTNRAVVLPATERVIPLTYPPCNTNERTCLYAVLVTADLVTWTTVAKNCAGPPSTNSDLRYLTGAGAGERQVFRTVLQGGYW